MKIGLIDVDGKGKYPNLALMKISAYHKRKGDSVKWYEELFDGPPEQPMDRVYMSKVFTFTPDYEYAINAKEVIKGGTGYFYPDGGKELPKEIEHVYPDYELYGIKDRAYGFLTRGCPRQCSFCVVKEKEGTTSRKVADLSEFWKGQKEIVLMDPNILACKDHMELLKQCADSGARIEFNQGIDARLLTEENTKAIQKIKLKCIHFAWDRPKDEKSIVPKLKRFKEVTGIRDRDAIVYVLTNYDTTFEEDLYRVYTIRDIGMTPYVMIYNKDKTKRTDPVRRLQSWVNNKRIWYKDPKMKFEDFDRSKVRKEKIWMQ